MPGQTLAELGVKSKLPGKLGLFLQGLQCALELHLCVCRGGRN